MDSSEWEYHAEGGANIVFRYSGSEAKYAKKVLRIRKKTNDINHLYTSLLPKYHSFIYRNLNLNEHSNTIDCINVSKKFLEELNKNCFHQRPEHRRMKAEIDTSLSEVLLLPDLLSEPFSCEIKPKWCGLNHLHGTNEVCSCRYCLAQISKGRRPLLSSNSHIIYCPKLFFSKDKSKISKAVLDLFRNPSNQFKLFIDSVAMSPDRLLSFSEDLNSILTEIMAVDPLLQNIIHFQDKLLDGVPLSEINTSDIDPDRYVSDIESMFTVDQIERIPFYLRILLAMTIRDASIIISFTREHADSFSMTISVNGNVLYYKIDMIDLDIKPLSNLKRYVEEIKLHG